MAQKWYQKATVQQKFVGGGVAVLVVVIPIMSGIFIQTPPPAPGISEKAYQAAIDKIDEVRSKLQGELDREKQRGSQLARGVQGALGSAAAVARLRHDSEIKRLAEQLRQLLAQFDSDFGDAPLSEVDDLRKRLAEATASNAERTYRKTLTIITKEDVDSDSLGTDAQIEREAEARQIRGDALYGLREWREALVNYDRILALRPGRWNTRSDAANCLDELGRLPPALEHYNAIVVHYTRLVEQEGRAELANDLAATHNNRGVLLDTRGKLSEALQDYDKAIDVYTHLVEQKGRAELANQWARVLNNRGDAFTKLGQQDQALTAYKKALVVATSDSMRSRAERALRQLDAN